MTSLYILPHSFHRNDSVSCIILVTLPEPVDHYLGVGLLQKNGESRTDMEEEEALLHSLDIVDVYSNSWGPADGGRTVKGPGNLVKQAFEMGVNDVRKVTIIMTVLSYMNFAGTEW